MRELIRQEDGQDLVEYGLLALFIALASVAVWLTIANAMNTAYRGYDSGVQDLWQPCEPGDPHC